MNDMSSTLRRKLAPSRAASVPGGSSVEALLRKVMPRVADEELSLDLTVGTVVMGGEDKVDVLGRLNSSDLVYRLEGPGQTRGICIMTSGLLAGLIEVQMSGRVSNSPAPDRKPTRTDGIVAGDVLDVWVEKASLAAGDEGIAETFPLSGYTRGSGILDRRNSDLMLDPQRYKTLSIELTLGDNAKSGTLYFALPEHGGGNAKTGRKNAEKMQGHMRGIATAMTAILTRLPQPIERVRDLAVGDVLKVPVASLVGVRLEGVDDHLITTARLGQLNGQKAVRLNLNARERAGLGVAGAGASGGDLGFELPSGSEVPSLGAGQLPDLPEVPALESATDLADLPDLPDLPELPDLPALD